MPLLNTSCLVLTLLAFSPFQDKSSDPEPSLQGKTLTQWMELLSREDVGQTADARMKSKRGALIALELLAGSYEPKIIEAVSKVMAGDSDPKIREAAAGALVRIALKISQKSKTEEPKDMAVISLRQVLKTDKDSKVREMAAQGLGKLVPQAVKALDVLAASLDEKEAGIRIASADAIRKLGEQAKPASKQLQILASNKNADIISRSHACLALGNIREEAALPFLLEIMEARNEALDLQVASAKAFSMIPLKDKEIPARLGKVLIAPSTARDLKLALVVSLDQMGKLAQPATEALIAVLADRDGAIRAIAIHALGNMGPELGPMLDRARNAVGNMLMDSSADVRLSALETLGRWGPSLVDMATASKVEKLEKDSSKEVRETAKLVLARLRGPAPK